MWLRSGWLAFEDMANYCWYVALILAKTGDVIECSLLVEMGWSAAFCALLAAIFLLLKMVELLLISYFLARAWRLDFVLLPLGFRVWPPRLGGLVTYPTPGGFSWLASMISVLFNPVSPFIMASLVKLPPRPVAAGGLPKIPLPLTSEALIRFYYVAEFIKKLVRWLFLPLSGLYCGPPEVRLLTALCRFLSWLIKFLPAFYDTIPPLT